MNAVTFRQRTAVGEPSKVERTSTSGDRTEAIAGARMKVIGTPGFPSNVPTVLKLPSSLHRRLAAWQRKEVHAALKVGALADLEDVRALRAPVRLHFGKRPLYCKHTYLHLPSFPIIFCHKDHKGHKATMCSLCSLWLKKLFTSFFHYRLDLVGVYADHRRP